MPSNLITKRCLRKTFKAEIPSFFKKKKNSFESAKSCVHIPVHMEIWIIINLLWF